MQEQKPQMIFSKLSNVMRDLTAVGKEGYNTQQNFKFRRIDDFLNSLHPALIKNGVLIVPRRISYARNQVTVTRSSGKSGIDTHVELEMEYDLYAEDGSKITVGPIPGEAIDSGDKATTKALTAAYKYFLIETFVFPTEDMLEAEGDKDSHEVESFEQNKESVLPKVPVKGTLKPPGASKIKATPGGDYIIPFGFAKGQTIQSQTIHSIKKSLKFCQDANKAPEYQEAMLAYLDAMTQQDLPPAKPKQPDIKVKEPESAPGEWPSDDDIPF